MLIPFYLVCLGIPPPCPGAPAPPPPFLPSPFPPLLSGSKLRHLKYFTECLHQVALCVPKSSLAKTHISLDESLLHNCQGGELVYTLPLIRSMFLKNILLCNRCEAEAKLHLRIFLSHPPNQSVLTEPGDFFPALGCKQDSCGCLVRGGWEQLASLFKS